MIVEIMNWDKFNPRRDVKSTSWFRLQNTFWQDHKFFELDNDGKMVWIALLSTASQEQKGDIEINPDLIGAVLKVGRKKILKVLGILEEKHCVRVTSELRTANVPTQTDEQTDRQTERTDETGAIASDDGLTPKDVFTLWNMHRGPLPEAKSLTSSREKKLQAQIRKSPEYQNSYHWEQAIRGFTESEFCVSEWRPGFDDLISESKRMKALEGKYANKRRGQKTFSELTSEGNADLMRRAREGEFSEFEN
jgi:hypothetical protein